MMNGCVILLDFVASVILGQNKSKGSPDLLKDIGATWLVIGLMNQLLI